MSEITAILDELRDTLAGPDIRQRSDRGFARGERIHGHYGDQRSGGHAEVYESSNAEAPHLWLHVVEPDDLNEAARIILSGADTVIPIHGALLHLTVDDAIALASQLLLFAANHYQLAQ